MPSRSFSEDAAWMARALTLASRARGRTSPNPMVGAVVVQKHRVVGEGYHHRAGTAHAEPLALRQAGARAHGATLYVTLEPCHHTGRTGPCTQAIVGAGIARVVVGAPDNDARAQGRGLVFLRKHNVLVDAGVLAKACSRLNTPYHFAKATGRAFVSSFHVEGAANSARVAQYERQLRRSVDALVVSASHWQRHEEDLRAASARATGPKILVWDPFGGVDPQRVHRANGVVVRPAGAPSASTIVAMRKTWSLPAASPWAQLALRCQEHGLHHISLFHAPELAAVAQAEGVLCRSLWVAEGHAPRDADWSRNLDSGHTAYATWQNEADVVSGRSRL